MGFRSLVCIFSIIVVLSAFAAQPPDGIFPIVSGRNGVIFGGVFNRKWADVEVMQEKMKGDEQYRLYSATKYLGVTTGSAVQEDGGTSPFIQFDVPAGVKSTDVIVAVGGTWNPLPRLPKAQDVKQTAYQDIVREILTRKGLPDAKVNITRLWRIDLDGDGTEEVLINATTPRKDLSRDKPYKSGDYSMVLLRKVIKGKVETILIELSYYPHDYQPDTGLICYPAIYTLEGCFDLNGDGVMEVITHSDALPDLWDTIYQIKGLTVTRVLTAGEWI